MVEQPNPHRAWIVLEAPDGTREELPITGPGGTERLAVGAPGRRSSVWRIWATKTKSDVYVASRTIAAVQKYSFHESGDWRYQWTVPNHAVNWTGQPNRIIDRWTRPAEDPLGWVTALTIWVPHGELMTIDGPDPQARGVDFIPEAKPGWLMGLRVIVAQPNRGIAELRRAVPIAGFFLANGQIALVLAGTQEITDDHQTWLDENRERALRTGSVPPGRDIRMGLFGTGSRGDRFVYDLRANDE